MSFEIEGKLIKKFDTETKTQTFQAREFVIEINNGNYPQFIKFQLTQDRCSIIDAYNEEEDIKVFFDLRGREWNGKYFTNLNAWRVEKANIGEGPVSINQGSQNAPESFPSMGDEPAQSEFEDDLPF